MKRLTLTVVGDCWEDLIRALNDVRECLEYRDESGDWENLDGSASVEYDVTEYAPGELG